MANARQIAYNALLKIEKDKAYSNIALDSLLSKSDLDTRDKSFVSALLYGTIERKLTIDYQLSKYLSKPLKKLKPEVLTILRLGAYQLLYMDKIPSSAAVNESVNLSKKNGCAFASGLINAVLRKIDRSGIILPDEKYIEEYLSIKYSCPCWLVQKWITEYGASDTEAFLAHSVNAPENYIRVNTTLTTSDELIGTLEKEGVKATKTDIMNALKVDFSGIGVEALQAYKDGLFHVQDLSCQLCAMALRAEKGMTVFDLCSAPGGKAYTVCEIMKNEGKVLCFDIHKSRVDLILNGAGRLSLSSICGEVSDATVFNGKIGLADRVLCDVPCSGLGIIGRKPEIKYKNEDELNALPDLQLKILKNGSKYVKKGGIIVYSTCSLSKNENELVCEKFLEAEHSFEAIAPLPEFSDEKFLTLMPHKIGSDGFFIAAFINRGDINEG